MKGIVFKSSVSQNVYLWNGEVVICIFKYNSQSSYQLGKIMCGFKEIDFERLHSDGFLNFDINGCYYHIICKF